jgi:hypothetical protein
MKRRDFLTTLAAAGAALGVSRQGSADGDDDDDGGRRHRDPPLPPPPHLTWQLWSRHLQWVSTQAQTVSDPYGVGVLVGQYALESGYSAVGLTVRDGGHVQPENTATHLPGMLRGIRSTGCICDHIGATDINPPVDPEDISWITSQRVYEVLSVAAANGIKRYRCGNRGFPSNIFGDAMHAQLEGLRTNHQRLAEINEQYGLNALYHTQTSIGVTVWEFVRVLQGPMPRRETGNSRHVRWIGSPPISPFLVGLNFAIGHVGREMPIAGWQTALRYAMPYVRGLALHGPQINRNASTGQLQNTVVPAAQSHINFTTMFSLLRQGGYNGAAEAQIEHSIVGANGTSVSLNNAFFADNAQFVSGNLTPAIMVREMKAEVDFYKSRALAAGWTADQMT